MKDSLERISAAVISRVVAEHAGEPQPGLEMALEKAYPFGRKSGLPYQIWRDELARRDIQLIPKKAVAGVMSIRVRMRI